MKKLLQIIATLAAILLASTEPVHASEITVPAEIVTLTEEIGAEYGICPELLQAIACKENRFDPEAENDGCIGLMQINVRWHRERMDRLGVSDLTDPEESMRVAADYLAELREKHGDVGVVLMEYNGFSDAEGYVLRTGKLSGYATEILELSAEFERRKD